MQKLFLKPAVPGAIVRQPDRDMRPLAQDGEWVQASTFWHLRLLNGDVIEADPPKESAASVSSPGLSVGPSEAKAPAA
jgi:hypothetical protein